VKWTQTPIITLGDDMKNRELLERENDRMRSVNELLIDAWESLLRITPEIAEVEKQAPATFAKVRQNIEWAKNKMSVKN
jgi:hypothetical protein